MSSIDLARGVGTLIGSSSAPLTIPTRREACSIFAGFQGRYYDSDKYSESYSKLPYNPQHRTQVPYFGGAYQDFYAVGDGSQILDQILANKETHCMFTHGRGGAGYNEANQPYGLNQLIPPANQTDKEFLDMADYVISRIRPVFLINGEGQDGYNEIKNTFQAQINLLRTGYDRTEYGPCLVVYDGVWPDSWSVAQMKEMIPFMRNILGNKGYLGFMFGNGPAGRPYMWVEDENDYHKDWMDGLDIVAITSGPGEAEGVSLANKAQFLLKNPNYSQFKPDFHSPFILFDNSRGERYAGLLESATYQTVRDPNQDWKDRIEQSRQWAINMGYPVVG